MKDFEQALDEAMDASEQGKHGRAVTLFGKLIAAYPQEPQPRFERGMALLEQGKDQEAIADFEAALALQADYPGARDWLARTLAGQGSFLLAAETKLRDLITTSDEPGRWSVSPQGWADCANYFIEAGDLLKAKDVLEMYFERYEKKVEAYLIYTTAPWRAYASILLKTGDVQTAYQFACKAAQHPKHVPADEFVWIECLAHRGQIEAAEKELLARAEFERTVPYVAASETVSNLRRPN